jgi:hypothetical protein
MGIKLNIKIMWSACKAASEYVQDVSGEADPQLLKCTVQGNEILTRSWYVVQ